MAFYPCQLRMDSRGAIILMSAPVLWRSAMAIPIRPPLLHSSWAWLAEGCHVNVVGSSIPSMREVDDDLVLATSIWVDYLPSALAQADEIVSNL